LVTLRELRDSYPVYKKGECTMDKKTTGLIATIATAVLCGCPGLFGLCMGSTSLIASFVPGADIDVFGSNDPAAATTMGFVFLCLSLIFIAIPIVVGVVTLRKPKEEAPTVVEIEPSPELKPVDDEPLPPAS
jgi:hypothetical protein